MFFCTYFRKSILASLDALSQPCYVGVILVYMHIVQFVLTLEPLLSSYFYAYDLCGSIGVSLHSIL